VFDQVAGFGPLQQYFDDRAVEEIWINEPASNSQDVTYSQDEHLARLTLASGCRWDAEASHLPEAD
jgi:type IV secretory pathway ATPase VirB11/archaellum biosynthesis ATPase